MTEEFSSPKIVASYKEEIIDGFVLNFRFNPICISSPAIIRAPKQIYPVDPFLAYLEYKMSKPFFKRIFLP